MNNMKFLMKIILIFGLLSGCNSNTQTKKKPQSPHRTVMTMIGDAHIHIDYSSPGVRGRTIFGELISYGDLWRAGANNATWLETNKDLLIYQQTLPAGKYGVFIIPSPDSWAWIFNKNWNQHGTDDYKTSEDVFRFDLPVIHLEKVQEHLEYQVKKIADESGIITVEWEKTKVEFPLTILQ